MENLSIIEPNATLEAIKNIVTIYGMKLIAGIIIIIIGRWAAMLMRSLVEKVMLKHKVEQTLISFVRNLVYISLLAFVIISALGVMGIQTASFAALIAAAGLAIGLALQGSLSNFAAGVLLILFKPLKVGDFVEAGGVMGSVKMIGIFTTEIATPDNKKIIIPNAKISGDKITNFGGYETRRINIDVCVSYDDDIDKVKKVLMDIAEKDERVLKDPEPGVFLVEMAESSMNFAFRLWVKGSDYWTVLTETNEIIKKRLDEEKISIPYPQQDVHVYKEN